MIVTPKYCDFCNFESEIFDHPVWRLNDASMAIDAVEQAKKYGVNFISCSIKSGNDGSKLTAAGFRLVDGLVNLQIKTKDLSDIAIMPENIRLAKICDIKACEQIAKKSFKYDRFHLDMEISNHIADNIKAAWIKNSIIGRADAVFCAYDNDKAIGFNSCMLSRDCTVVGFDLMAVDPEFQGRSIGSDLINAMAVFYRNKAKYIKLGTPSSNKTALKIYQSRGFEITSMIENWHWVYDGIGI